MKKEFVKRWKNPSFRSLNFSNSDLSSLKMWGESFYKMNMCYCNFDNSTYSDCDFSECDFSHSEMNNCSFDNCSFDNCSFDNLSEIENVEFYNCKFLNSSFEENKNMKNLKIWDSYFKNSNWNYNISENVVFEDIKFENCGFCGYNSFLNVTFLNVTFRNILRFWRFKLNGNVDLNISIQEDINSIFTFKNGINEIGESSEGEEKFFQISLFGGNDVLSLQKKEFKIFKKMTEEGEDKRKIYCFYVFCKLKNYRRLYSPETAEMKFEQYYKYCLETNECAL